jgi:hypothetical protein
MLRSKLSALSLALLLCGGCATITTTKKDGCTVHAYRDAYVSIAGMKCDDGIVVAGAGTSPVAAWASAANASILNFSLPLTYGLLTK